MTTNEECTRLRQELNSVRSIYEQRLQDSNTRFKRLQRFSENQKHQLEEIRQNVTQAEQEKTKAINDCKAANERLDKLHLELAFMERNTLEQITILRSQFQQQIFELQNELQSVKMSEYQWKNKLTIADAEKESLRAQLTSMENDVKQWQSLIKTTSDSKNAEIDSLNSKVEN
ncbi:6319_t:CDS:2, partial [Acaulospora morrowiae]